MESPEISAFLPSSTEMESPMQQFMIFNLTGTAYNELPWALTYKKSVSRFPLSRSELMTRERPVD